MPADQWGHESFELMKAEHEELAKALTELRDAVGAPNRDRNHISGLLARLCDLVESHFSHEERGGYLKDALNRAPRFSAQAALLLEQHEALQEELEKLRLLVHAGVETPGWWTRVESDLHQFATRLVNHEHAENKVVQEAYTVDIGTND